MIESANDAANGLAQYVSGSLSAFADLMNRRAAQIGAVDSHFVNANGLPDDDHYTSAYDIAVITRWRYVPASELFGAEEYTITPTQADQARRFGRTSHACGIAYYYNERKLQQADPGGEHTLFTLAKRDGWNSSAWC
jgi:D-alanyl-D-alanine carboxypeptidase